MERCARAFAPWRQTAAGLATVAYMSLKAVCSRSLPPRRYPAVSETYASPCFRCHSQSTSHNCLECAPSERRAPMRWRSLIGLARVRRRLWASDEKLEEKGAVRRPPLFHFIFSVGC